MLFESPGGSSESLGGKKRGKETRDSLYLERSSSGEHLVSGEVKLLVCRGRQREEGSGDWEQPQETEELGRE